MGNPQTAMVSTGTRAMNPIASTRKRNKGPKKSLHRKCNKVNGIPFFEAISSSKRVKIVNTAITTLIKKYTGTNRKMKATTAKRIFNMLDLVMLTFSPS